MMMFGFLTRADVQQTKIVNAASLNLHPSDSNAILTSERISQLSAGLLPLG